MSPSHRSHVSVSAELDLEMASIDRERAFRLVRAIRAHLAHQGGWGRMEEVVGGFVRRAFARCGAGDESGWGDEGQEADPDGTGKVENGTWHQHRTKARFEAWINNKVSFV